MEGGGPMKGISYGVFNYKFHQKEIVFKQKQEVPTHLSDE